MFPTRLRVRATRPCADLRYDHPIGGGHGNIRVAWTFNYDDTLTALQTDTGAGATAAQKGVGGACGRRSTNLSRRRPGSALGPTSAPRNTPSTATRPSTASPVSRGPHNRHRGRFLRRRRLASEPRGPPTKSRPKKCSCRPSFRTRSTNRRRRFTSSPKGQRCSSPRACGREWQGSIRASSRTTSSDEGERAGGKAQASRSSFAANSPSTWAGSSPILSRTVSTSSGVTERVSWDRTHVLSVVLGYYLGRGWRVRSRLFLESGRPFEAVCVEHCGSSGP
jgi:hypothetical protein